MRNKRLYVVALGLLSGLTAMAQFRVTANGTSMKGNTAFEGIPGTAAGKGVVTVISDTCAANAGQNTAPVLLSIKNKAYANHIAAYNKDSIMNFFVDYDGYVYANGHVILSDFSGRENVKTIPSPLEGLKELRSVSFNTKEEQTGNLGFTPGTAQERNGKRIGLVAQEVENAFPEVVRTQSDGTKGILYDDLVAVLVAAVNELQDSMAVQAAKVEAMQQQMNAIQAMLLADGKQVPSSPETKNGDSGNGLGQATGTLSQNTPNPFNRSTTINYQVQSDASEALICIYNLGGVQLKQYPINVTGAKGQLIVEASTLAPGMYVYGLVVDGKLCDAKRMVVTE